MKSFAPTVRRSAIGMALAGMILATTCPAPTHGEFLGCFKSEYQPRNVFSYPDRLPYDLHRVAVLPLVPAGDNDLTKSGCETLGPVLVEELTRTKKFEVVKVDAATLDRLTGRPGWSGGEVLPADILTSLQDSSGCDALMFCELTAYHPYPPLAVGWRLKLVDVNTKQIIWAADEIFDDSDPAVARGAKRFGENQDAESGSWMVEHSPRSFGRYAAAALLAQLPKR